MGRKAIVGGRVIDGTGGDPIEPGIVLVDEGKIERVGEAEAVPVPEDAEVIIVGINNQIIREKEHRKRKNLFR